MDFDALVGEWLDASVRLVECTARLYRLEWEAPTGGPADQAARSRLAVEYRNAEEAETAARNALARGALRAWERKRLTATTSEPSSDPSPAQVTPELRFARWLYDRGRLTS